LDENPSHLLSEILQKLNLLDAKVSILTAARSRKPADPEYLSLVEAAVLVGRSVRGLQSWLGRCADDPDKPSVRRLHGRVHKKDLLGLVEASRMVGRGEIVRNALERVG
jgi:hypothetical protein